MHSYFDIGLVVFILIGFALLLWVLLIRPYFRQRRALKVLGQKYGSNPLFVIAQVGDSRAICRWEDYRRAKENPGKFPAKSEPWEQKFVFPMRTFVFSLREKTLPIHLGDWSLYQKFVGEILAGYLGVKYNPLHLSSPSSFVRHVFREVPDLFVPYVSILTGFTKKQQHEYYNPDKWGTPDAILYLVTGKTPYERYAQTEKSVGTGSSE